MSAVGNIAEVLGWTALACAVPFALVALVLHFMRGPWDSAPAAMLDGKYRWMSADGSFHSSPAAIEQAEVDDDLVVFYRTRRPEKSYPERVAHDERTCRVVAAILASVGALGLVVSGVAALL